MLEGGTTRLVQLVPHAAWVLAGATALGMDHAAVNVMAPSTTRPIARRARRVRWVRWLASADLLRLDVRAARDPCGRRIWQRRSSFFPGTH
jgi:hypothetical protein